MLLRRVFCVDRPTLACAVEVGLIFSRKKRGKLYQWTNRSMDCHFCFILLGFFLCLLSSLALQTSGFEGLTAAKIQAENEKEANKSGQQQDAVVVSSETETGASLVAQLPADTGHDNTTKDDAKPGKQEARSSSLSVPPPPPPPPPPPSLDKKDETSKEENNTNVQKSAPKVEESDDHLRDNDNNSETIFKENVRNCGGSHCEDPKKLISACLSIPGDGPHKLSLFISYEGDASVVVKVIAPGFLIADPLEVSVSKGKSETIHFSMDTNLKMDSKAMQNKTIVVTSKHGDCEIEVPMEYLSDERAPILPSVEPRVIAFLLVFLVIVSCVGAWLCYKCCGKKRAGEVKYQQLEMNEAGQSTPKERVEGATDSWDKIWDDGWEDAEAAMSSSRLSQSLSSRGLAARRGTKDGWDNSWED